MSGLLDQTTVPKQKQKQNQKLAQWICHVNSPMLVPGLTILVKMKLILVPVTSFQTTHSKINLRIWKNGAVMQITLLNATILAKKITSTIQALDAVIMDQSKVLWKPLMAQDVRLTVMVIQKTGTGHAILFVLTELLIANLMTTDQRNVFLKVLNWLSSSRLSCDLRYQEDPFQCLDTTQM